MANKYIRQEKYTEQSRINILQSQRYSLIKLIWRGYITSTLKEVTGAIYLCLEIIVCMYFTGFQGLLATAIVYPIYNLIVSCPIMAISNAAATYINKELELEHVSYANAYLLVYVLLSLCWSIFTSLLFAPMSGIILTGLGTSTDRFTSKYLVLSLSIGSFCFIFSEGMTPIHAVEQRYFLMLIYGVTRYLFNALFLFSLYYIEVVTRGGTDSDIVVNVVKFPAVAQIITLTILSIWIFSITCQKTIFGYPLNTSLNLLAQTRYVWQWKVFRRVLLTAIPFYLNSIYEPIMLLISNILVAKFFTNPAEAAIKRISFLLFYWFRRIFMLSSRSFSFSYQILMQKYYFNCFYQKIETILLKLTFINYLISLLVGVCFVVIAPLITKLLQPISFIRKTGSFSVSEIERSLFLNNTSTAISNAAAASLLLVALDLVFTVQTLRETYLFNCVEYVLRLCFGLTLVLVIGLINKNNSNIERAFLITEIPLCVLTTLISLLQIYDHVFLSRLETFYALTNKSGRGFILTSEWAAVHQRMTETVIEKKRAYRYLRFITTGKSEKND